MMVNDWYKDYNPLRDIGFSTSVPYLWGLPFASTNSSVDLLKQNALSQTNRGYSTNSNLINGRSESADPTVKLPLEVFDVVQGTSNRFRIINAATGAYYYVSIDNHKFQVVSTDGSDNQAVNDVESVLIGPGERYDIIVSANQPIGNYWIR